LVLKRLRELQDAMVPENLRKSIIGECGEFFDIGKIARATASKAAVEHCHAELGPLQEAESLTFIDTAVFPARQVVCKGLCKLWRIRTPFFEKPEWAT